MPTRIAVLGATGKTGRIVLQRLLSKPDVELRVYVRSQTKLLSLFPSLATESRVSIFPGAINNTENMRKCLDSAHIIIFALGENLNLPGISIIEDGAKSVLSALTALKSGQTGTTKPRIIMLSSATWNEEFAAARPPLVHWLIKTAFYYPYADLRRGTALFENASDLIDLCLVQPNGLIEEDPSGHIINNERVTLACSYADLGAAIVDLALEKEYELWSRAGISSKSGDDSARYLPILGPTILRGFLSYIPGYLTLRKWLDTSPAPDQSKAKPVK